MDTYRVRVGKDIHVFSAAHFITFNGTCERLHGHNYRVAAEVEGLLDENQYVIDFIGLRDVLGEIVQRLDHHVILPTEHPQIHVGSDDDEVHVRFEKRRWVFPRDDCILLPVANTTSELLARHIGQSLGAELERRCGFRFSTLRVEVDECFGQVAVCELSQD